jgi:hypothetical protein
MTKSPLFVTVFAEPEVASKFNSSPFTQLNLPAIFGLAIIFTGLLLLANF